MPRSLDVWMSGCVYLRVSVWVCGCVYVRMCLCVDVWMCGCVDVWMRGCVWMCGCVDVWMCGRADVRTCGRVAVVCVDMWICGCVNAWMRGCVDATGHLRFFRVVNPLFGEWLYGLERGWTDRRARVKACPQADGALKSFDTFTGIGGLTLAGQGFFEPIAYSEMNSDCVAVPLSQNRKLSPSRKLSQSRNTSLRNSELGKGMRIASFETWSAR